MRMCFIREKNQIRMLLTAIALISAFLCSAGRACAQYTWKSVAINGGGFVPGLVYSPVQQGLLYARTDVGGFYRWNNSAGQWVPLTDMFGLNQSNNCGGESIAPDPVDANVVYAAAGFSGTGSILSSTDQGASWTVHSVAISIAGNNDGREAGERLVVDPHLTSKLYFGSRWQGLWVSTTSASSWSQVSFPVNGDAGYGLSWVIFDTHGATGSASATVYVGVMAMSSGNSNIYRSTNAGGNWSLITGGPSNMVTPHASLSSDGNLWIVYDSGGYGPNSVSTGQIWKLNTTTLGWTNVTPSIGPGSGSGGYAGISVDASNANHAVVTTIDWWSGPDKVLSTVNGGGAWSVIAMAGSSNSVFNVNGANYQKGCNNGSGGAGWAGCVAIDPFNSNNAVYPSGGAGGGGGVWSSTNIQSSPVSWTYTDKNLEETVPIFMNPSAAGGILFSCLGDVGGMRHTDVTQSPSTGMYCNPQFSNTNMLDFAESKPNTVVRVGNSGTTTSDVAYSTNNGQSWSPWGSAPPGYSSNNQMGSVAVAADGSMVVVSPYSGYGSPAYASSLGGGWTSCSGLPSGACVASDRSNASTFYATYPMEWVYGNSVTVYRSTDYGKNFAQVNTVPVSWGDANGNGQWVLPRPVFGVAGEFWVSTYNALYRFTNGGSSVTALSNVYEPMGPVGFGKAASGQTHPAVFMIGTVNGTYGFYRCDDGTGATWTQIMDSNHQYGSPNWMEGDETIYGRCYIGAGGRGIVYGDVVAVIPTSTPTMTMSSTLTRTFTATPTRTTTSTLTATPSPTSTETSTRTATPVSTSTTTSTTTRTFTWTTTSTPTPTPTSTCTVTSTPTRTFTTTMTATATSSPTSSATSTWTATTTSTSTSTRSFTPTSTATSLNTSTFTFTATRTPTWTTTFTPTPTLTFTWTPSSTGTWTATSTPTRSFTLTATAILTSTVTGTPTATGVFTSTVTDTPISTVTSTSTATRTATSTSTSTSSWTSTGTPTSTPTSTSTATTTPTWTASATATLSSTSTITSTPTWSATGTQPPTGTFTVTSTPIDTSTTTFTSTATGTSTVSFTSTWTMTATSTSTPTPTPSSTPSATSTATMSYTSTLTVTGTATWTHTNVPVFTFTGTYTPSVTPTPSATGTWSATPTATSSWTSTRTSTPTSTASMTPTASLSATASRTFTNTSTPTGTATPPFTPSATPSHTLTATWTRTWTPTTTPTPSGTSTWTVTDTPTWSPTSTLTVSWTPTWTPEFTATDTPTVSSTPTQQGGCDHLRVSVAYPNPVFKGPVKFDLGGYCPQGVRWAVFTSAYRKVGEWVAMQSGAKWDLTDAKGVRVAPGLYFAVFTVNGKSEVRKFVVLP